VNGYAFIGSIILEPGSWFEEAANAIIDALPEGHRENAGHWLCSLLLDAAKAVDPATYAGFIADGVKERLIGAGVSKAAANIFAAAVTKTLNPILAHAIGLGHASLAMKALIPAVCPDLDRCPAQKDLFKTFAMPGVVDHLEALAAK